MSAREETRGWVCGSRTAALGWLAAVLGLASIVLALLLPPEAYVVASLAFASGCAMYAAGAFGLGVAYARE